MLSLTATRMHCPACLRLLSLTVDWLPPQAIHMTVLLHSQTALGLLHLETAQQQGQVGLQLLRRRPLWLYQALLKMPFWLCPAAPMVLSLLAMGL